MKKENLLVLHSLLSSRESDAILADTRDVAEQQDLFKYLLQQQIVLAITEIDQHQDHLILDFTHNRLQAFGIDLDINEKKLFKNVSKAIKKERIVTTEIIPYIVRKLKKAMDKNYTLCQIERADEFFYLAVLPKKKLKKLLPLTTPIGTFHKISKPSLQEILYIIECDCGMSNVWQLRENETRPNQGLCNSCQKDLFNPQGTPIFAVIIEPLIG